MLDSATGDEEVDEEGVDAAVEEVKDDGDGSEEAEFVYDRALYDADALEEDVDFDDD